MENVPARVQHETNLPALLGINERRILEIKEQSQNLVISDSKSYDATRQLRTEVVTMRTTLEKKRKELGEPYRRKLDEIKQEADRLKGMILTVEEPLQATVRAWEAQKEQEKKEREEQELRRKDALMAKIANIKNMGTPPIDLNSQDLKTCLEQCQSLSIEQADFQEYLEEAKKAQDYSVQLLQKRILVQQDHEERTRQYELERKRQREEAEYTEMRRQEFEKKTQFEKECREVIAFYANFPASLVDKNLEDTQNLLMGFRRKMPDPELGDFFQEALDAYTHSLEVGIKMLSNKIEIHEQQEALRYERERKEEINKLYRLPTNARAFPTSKEVSDYLTFCEKQEPTQEKFKQYFQEAFSAWTQAIEQVEDILEQKIQAENFLREHIEENIVLMQEKQQQAIDEPSRKISNPEGEKEDHPVFVAWCDEIKTAIGRMPELVTEFYAGKALALEEKLLDLIDVALNQI